MGGYLPFSYDITEALKEEKNLLTVKVRDYSETCYYSRGKQKLKKRWDVLYGTEWNLADRMD